MTGENMMEKTKAKVTYYEPGRAVGVFIGEPNITDEDIAQWPLEEREIEYVAEVPGFFEGSEDSAVMGSVDGKKFNLLVGLRVDGKPVDLVNYYGNMNDRLIYSEQEHD